MAMNSLARYHVICVFCVVCAEPIYNEDLLYLRSVQCSVVKNQFQECVCEEKTLCVISGVGNSVKLL
jgi:hypothetical protein